MNPVWSSAAHEAIGRLVRARAGLTFGPNRVADAEAGIRRAMERSHVADPTAYLRRLESGAAELDDLIAELTVTETYFFREPEQFDFIRTHILPGLMKSARSGQPLRLWSAGCASGEEAYSLAILLEEAGFPPDAQVLATDISLTALTRARAASYKAWSFRGVDSAVLERHFRPRGDRHVPHARIRARVRIERLNLAFDVYPNWGNGTERLDLILCRNVLIYFDADTVRTVARRLWGCLAPSGWLLTGPSDPDINLEGFYETVVTPGGVVYRRPSGEIRYERPSPAKTPSAARIPEPSTTAAARITDASPSTGSDPMADAIAAFDEGDYGSVLELTQGLPEARAAALRIRALANACGAFEAEREASAAAVRYPLVAEIHLLQGVLLLALNRHEEATAAAKRCLYLDRSLAFGHFLLGIGLSRLRDLDGARRALQHAREICSRHAPDDLVAFSDGQRAGLFAEAIAAQLDLISGEAS